MGPNYVGPILPPVPPEPVLTATTATEPLVAGRSYQELLIPTTGPIALTVEDAILLTLERNNDLRIQRLNPLLRLTSEQVARAVFDPVLSASANYSRSRTVTFPVDPDTGERLDREVSTNRRGSGSVGISEFLPTGTRIEANVSVDGSRSTGQPKSYTASEEISITQSLLRGAGLAVNLASLNQAKIDTVISQYELRSFAEQTVATVEQTYWNYALAQRQINIFLNSLNVAQQQLNETNERIAVGKLAGIERAAAEAEVASRREALINARTSLAQTRLTFLSLLNPPTENYWNRDIQLLEAPEGYALEDDNVEDHVRLALRMRPDLNQAKLSIDRGEIELVRTRNGLLPRLDFFITLGHTGYSNSFHDSFVGDDQRTVSGNGGLNFEYPILNRSARAQNKRAHLSLDQTQTALLNTEQLIQVDVRSAYNDVVRYREQITATAATRQLREATLRSEQEKFRIGKSTTFLVAQAQRDLLVAQLSEIQAAVNYIKAIIDLYRLEGSLLMRRGIAAPGARPVLP
jgi:outer membrane protein TolC